MRRQQEDNDIQTRLDEAKLTLSEQRQLVSEILERADTHQTMLLLLSSGLRSYSFLEAYSKAQAAAEIDAAPVALKPGR